MATLSWNEIRHNAIRFTREWTGERREAAEKQTFWNEFFDVFGIRRRVVASFEEPVKKISGDYGFIDLFWPGIVLVEHKSAGANLGKAESQAFRYIQDLASSGRTKEIPRYVIVSDFTRIALHDLEPEDQRGLPLFDNIRVATTEFILKEFYRHIHSFAFIPGYKQHRFKEEDPINIKAVEILGALHDTLEAGGYSGHKLERFLVRILFCLFAEDTGLFERETFKLYILNRTAADGSDLGLHLARLFDVLNTDRKDRQQNLDETLDAFPYVNGALFAENLGFADFNRDMREALLTASAFDWSRISPAIFGSLFQAVMEPKERRQIGGHYTSERDILKLIRSLFLDDLREEFEQIKADRSTRRKARLEEFLAGLRELRFLDPACGCGNFLVITYRELRQIELEVLLELLGGQRELTLDEVNRLSQVDVDQLYGIELGEWPACIAEVALWLMDHQMNLKVSEAFGQLYQRLPLKKSPHIFCGNALQMNWNHLISGSYLDLSADTLNVMQVEDPPAHYKTINVAAKEINILTEEEVRKQKPLQHKTFDYILGNPPFIGAKFQDEGQRTDMASVAGDVKNSGLLDYVTGWYFKAAETIQDTGTVVGFVSTNSITQGEQAGVLWNTLFQKYGVKIHFGHRTFPWMSEARGKAHVHVVIVGFATHDVPDKKIYDHEGDQVSVIPAKNISPYLVEGSDLAVINRNKPLCDVPRIGIGNKPIDGGNYLFTPEEKEEFLIREPKAEPFFRRWLGADEFLNGIERWCLWLGDCPPGKLREMPEAMKRIEAVRDLRLKSKSAPTNKLATVPTRFHVENMPEKNYLLIPEVSSERRSYIPMGFISPDILSSNLVKIFPDATTYHFGIMSSAMHMAWVRQVCGRLKSDYRYSAKLVYNNYPWPEPTEKQRKAVEDAAQAVLDARTEFPNATLAALYDPLTMPPTLSKAHAALDRAVDKCYRPELFKNERQRVEHLFSLYEKLTAPLLPETPKKKKRRKPKTSG
ncbi:MAG: class I SAM-dependent DNA methyltransferase [Kiritimatiellaeota bacterium]|nr:class I SAM-dependent DNA methyltransferase [Kiritimatiellota bacterium]